MRNQTWFCRRQAELCLSAAPQFVRLNICMFFVCESYHKQHLNLIHFNLPCEQVSMFWFENKEVYDYPSLMSLSQFTACAAAHASLCFLIWTASLKLTIFFALRQKRFSYSHNNARDYSYQIFVSPLIWFKEISRHTRKKKSLLRKYFAAISGPVAHVMRRSLRGGLWA